MRKIKNTVLFISLLIFCNSLFAGKLNLDASINKLVDHYSPHAFVGIVVSDMPKGIDVSGGCRAGLSQGSRINSQKSDRFQNISGKTYYRRNASKLFLPGSNIKLFTCTAALLVLGADYQYSTEVKIKPGQFKGDTLNGDLYIKFTGDPSFTVSDLRRLVLQVKQAGIKQINGSVVLDNTIFKGDVYPSGMTNEDINAAYAAPATPIVLNQNKF